MNKHISIVLFAIASIVFASLLIRFSEAGPVASGAYRLLLTIPLLLCLDKFSGKKTNASKLTREIIIYSMLSGLFFALDLAVYNVSILYTSLAEATLLTNMAPFFIVPISIIFFQEKVPFRFIYAVILAIIGLYLLMGKSSLDQKHLIGDWLALLSAIFYALFLTSIKKAASNYSVNRVMVIVCLTGGILLFALAAAKQEIIFPQTTYGWFILFAIAISGQVLGQTLLAYGIKFLPLQLSSLFLLLSPIFAAIYALIIFNERLNLIQSSGIATILAAIYIGKRILELKKS